MATEDTKTKDAAAKPVGLAQEKTKGDLVSEIGTLTYPRAVQHFGKENALAAMHKVAAIGGHGLFEDAHFTSPLFGGLAMPSPDSVIKPRKEDFAHLPEGDFYFDAAVEEYEANKEKASSARAEINEYFQTLK
jgi:hypothetical protein